MKAHYFILIVVFILFSAGPGNAKTADFSHIDYENIPVKIDADVLNFEQQSDHLIASGDVVITQGNRILKAENVNINLVTRETEARGNVELNQGDDIIYCDSFKINLDTQIGSVKDARIFIKQQNIHITGRNIEKTGLNTYAVTNGTVTTCDSKTAPWKIDAKKIDVTVEGYARVRGSTFKIKDVPVFYLPYTVLPIMTKRQSGFLYPEIGHSSSEGAKFNNSFFWAISQNSDATLWLDAATKRGLGTGLEYRFKLDEDSWGKFYGYFTEERDRYFEDEYSEVRDRDRQRAYFDFEGEHYFNPDLYTKARLSYVSDREFFGDYRDEVRRSKGDFDKSSIKTKEKDESVFFINKNWNFTNVLLNYNLYKNLMHAGPDTLQRLPQVVLSSLSRPLPNTPLFFQYESSYDFLWREEGQKAHRYDVFPTISWPVNYNGWLKFKPEIGMRAMSYFAMHRNRGFDDEGLFPSLRAELSTTLIRIFNPDGNYIKKIKHTIEPGLRYENVPANDQSHFPEFDLPQHFFRRHMVSYYIKNRFTGLLADSQGGLEEREIGYFLLGQSFHLSDPKEGLYPPGEPGEDYSDLFGELRIGLLPDLFFKAKTFYNLHDSDARYFNALINWSNDDGEYLELEYVYADHLFENFDLEGSLKLTDFLSAFFDFRYDNRDNDDLDTEFGLDFSGQCWGSRISIETSSGHAGRSSDTSFNVRLYLKGLGYNFL